MQDNAGQLNQKLKKVRTMQDKTQRAGQPGHHATASIKYIYFYNQLGC